MAVSIDVRTAAGWPPSAAADPVTGKSIRHYRYGKTKQEALQKKIELLAKSEQSPVTQGLTASHS